MENDIFLEHVLYNTSGMLAQLGFDLDDQVRKLVANPLPGWPRDGATWDALRSAARPAAPISKSQPATGFDPDGFVRDLLNRIWNDRDFAALTDSYGPDFAFEGPTNRRSSGPEAYRAFLGTIFEAFPDIALGVDEVYWMGNETEGFLVSARWSAGATHRGAGLYGDPSGREVQVWGITQYEIRAGRVTREWMLFNELDLMMQIVAAKAS